MSVYRHKCLARCLIVTKTSFHAGFWCLSRIKRSTRLPNRKTFGDVRQLWLPFSALLGTCGLLSRAANLWSETNFFRDSNPCAGLALNSWVLLANLATNIVGSTRQKTSQLAKNIDENTNTKKWWKTTFICKKTNHRDWICGKYNSNFQSYVKDF